MHIMTQDKHKWIFMTQLSYVIVVCKIQGFLNMEYVVL